MANNSRDEKGRWLKGVCGNPNGRPKRHKEYADLVAGGVSAAEWRAVVKRALADAKKGDAQARKWLSDWLMGKATEFVQIEAEVGLSIEDWRELAEERRKAVETC